MMLFEWEYWTWQTRLHFLVNVSCSFFMNASKMTFQMLLACKLLFRASQTIRMWTYKFLSLVINIVIFIFEQIFLLWSCDNLDMFAEIVLYISSWLTVSLFTYIWLIIFIHIFSVEKAQLDIFMIESTQKTEKLIWCRWNIESENLILAYWIVCFCSCILSIKIQKNLMIKIFDTVKIHRWKVCRLEHVLEKNSDASANQ